MMARIPEITHKLLQYVSTLLQMMLSWEEDSTRQGIAFTHRIAVPHATRLDGLLAAAFRRTCRRARSMPRLSAFSNSNQTKQD